MRSSADRPLRGGVSFVLACAAIALIAAAIAVFIRPWSVAEAGVETSASGTFISAAALDWQPGAVMQPWRWWTAAFVHLSRLHLLANLAGLALVAALGAVARAPTSVTAAWVVVAWPLTQLGLLLEPSLTHYAGLSGVLHAGVALVAMHVITASGNGHTPVRRLLGASILVAMAIKVLAESPWAGPLQHREGWDIAIAPLAHATGMAAGVLTGLALAARDQLRMRLTSAVVE